MLKRKFYKHFVPHGTRSIILLPRIAYHRPLLLAVFLLFTAVCLLPPASCLAQSFDPGETIRIDADLVDLNVSVFARDRARPAGNLRQKDFAVFENGAPQEIAFFASAETPFDLVLLLDLSGSAAGKLDLIRTSARRFVEAAPPADRIGIVTFTDVPRVAAPLTSDRRQLKKAIEQIKKPSGGTNFWDALRYVLEVFPAEAAQSHRRRAVVVMTDGVDNALPDVTGDGSQITFEELLRNVRRSDSIVLPIYLDTEAETVKKHRVPASAYVLARQQLAELAEENGNVVYRAASLKDLKSVYEQVIRDLGTVYSLGYRSANRAHDGSWRTITVQLPARPDLAVRAKRGYYAK
ncbi:MAG: VWA domain-containing protein [Pyrinomonadaceae bacterium]